MNECKDCVQVINIKEDVCRLRDDIKEIYDRLGDVETTVARKEEQIGTIFNLLKGIQKSIDSISDKLENLERKPGNNAEKIKYIIITALTSYIVGVTIGFIVKK